MRSDGRAPDQLRHVEIHTEYSKHAEGSSLIAMGETRVICTASIEDRVPPFLKGGGQGWITAEYGMLPRATAQRTPRESSRGKPSGRTQEIQRLIGRSLRAITDLRTVGERTIWVDCDVIQADGGTRTASITGAFVALTLALRHLLNQGLIAQLPLLDFVAATSVGILEGAPVLDLDYQEDFRAEVDMNVVMTGAGKFVEIQGTAEHAPFGEDQLDSLLSLARKGIAELIQVQRSALGEKSSSLPLIRSR